MSETRVLLTVHELLGLAECQELINEAESQQFEPAIIRYESGAQMQPSVRNNDRLEWTNPELADSLWPRVSPFIPSKIDGHPAVGLDDWFRFYRYSEGQRFRQHRDGITRKPNQTESRLSFLIFLNESFSGGETVFYQERTEAGARLVERIVQPETGMGLIFSHAWLHEGSPVAAGTKYVLRSDVLYDVSKEELGE